ncbi:MAG: hypothetical protein EBV15_06335 [Bacteroidetes bacterium]|nr:hypothetical protein [Bacteroidota bacterium]
MLLVSAGSAIAQDTIVLRNNTRVVCTVTKIYPERIEYLNFGDSVKKQFYSYRKSDVLMLKYAGGKTDTFNNTAIIPDWGDTSASAKEKYVQGFEDGLARYKPTEERWAGVGAGFGTFLLPYGAIIVPIVYSVSKVPAKQIQDIKFVQNNQESYRKGYMDGATKRRRRAVWSAYGITTGTCAAALAGLFILVFY